MSAPSSASPVVQRASTGRSAEGGGSNTPPIAPPSKLKVLQSRVDALTAGFQLVASRTRFTEAFEAAEGAGHGRSAWSADGLTVGVQLSRSRGRLSFKNADARGVLDAHQVHGFCVEVSVSALYLATHPLPDALALCERLASMFGRVVDRRLRRVDLCADIGGWSVADTAAEGFIAQRRGRVKTYEKEMHRVGSVVTGFSVCPGNRLMLRVYDKRAELRRQCSEDKRALEEELWQRAGWRGEPVTRVEFQLRSEALKSLGMLEPAALPHKLDGAWAYCTKKWVRLSEPHSASRRDRWRLDARWSLVQGVVFVQPSAPSERQTVSGSGASAEQVLGTVRSFLASRGRLPEATEPSGADASAHAEAARSTLQACATQLSAELCAALLRKRGPSGGYGYVRRRHAAAQASHFSADRPGLRPVHRTVCADPGAPDDAARPTPRALADREASGPASMHQATHGLQPVPPRPAARHREATGPPSSALPSSGDRALCAAAAAAE